MSTKRPYDTPSAQLRSRRAYLFNNTDGDSGSLDSEQRRSTPASNKRHVLLVDDVNVNQKIAHACLHRAGFTCDVASNGKEAVAMVKSKNRSYSVILMDVQLPILDGVEATKQIREFQSILPSFNRCFIYGLTKTCDDKALKTYNQAGMDGCIEKGAVLSKATHDALCISSENPHDFVFINSRNVHCVQKRDNDFEPPFKFSGVSQTENCNDNTPTRVAKILLVDDLRVAQKVTAKSLLRSGYICDCANDGKSALSMCELHEYEIILMDVQLPDFDGAIATEKIRQFEKCSNRKPSLILGLTCSCTLLNLERYCESGMNGCIEKGCIINRAVVEAVEQLSALSQPSFIFVDAKNVHSFPLTSA